MGVGRLFWSFAWLSLFVGVGVVVGVPSFELDGLSPRYESGREEVNKLQQRAMLPSGNCWKAALEDLQVSCKGMIPENQSRLALRFTTCYNKMLGFPTVICEPTTPLKACMNKLDGNSQATFRDFFLHTQDMCYFIEHQLWQEKTSIAVNEVTNAVVDVTKNLEDAKETQEKVLQSQQESLKVQSSIIKDNSEIYSMVLNVKDVFEDVQASAVEQRQVVVEVFEKLTRMQKLVSWIQGEMSLLDMMGFYFVCVLFGVFGTSSKRTQNARFWVAFLLIATLASERYLYNYLNSLETYSPEVIQEHIWFLRRFMAAIGALLIVCTAAYYRDPQVVQQTMLALVNNRLERMSNQMEYMNKLIHKSSINGSILLEETLNHNNLGIEGNINLDDSDSDTYSNYTNDSETESNLAEMSGASGALKVVNEQDENESNDENKIPETDPKITNQFYRNITKRFASPRSRSREISVDRSTLNGSGHSYNLRIRNSTSNPTTPLAESPTQFVKQMKNARKMQESQNRRVSSYYSSDEDM